MGRGPRYNPAPPKFGPVPIWRLSMKLFRAGHYRSAKALKGLNFMLFKTVLPPEAIVGDNIRLEHWGRGPGCHPATTIGDNVHIYQHVQIGSTARITGEDRIIIEDDVVIGMGTKIVNSPGHTLVIGRGSQIGAHSLVTRSVPPYSRVRTTPSEVTPRTDPEAVAARDGADATP